MEKKTCPYCGEEIMATAKKCKHCGEWLETESNDTEHSASPTVNDKFQQNKEKNMSESKSDIQSNVEMSAKDKEYYDKGFCSFYNERIWKLYGTKSSGSVSRGEYWKFTLITIIVMYFAVVSFSLALTVISTSGFDIVDYATSRWIIILFLVVAYISAIYTCTCMVIRRLHDIGKNGWLSILGFIPIVNIILLVLLCQKGNSIDPNAKAKTKDYIQLIGLFIVSVLIHLTIIALSVPENMIESTRIHRTNNVVVENVSFENTLIHKDINITKKNFEENGYRLISEDTWFSQIGEVVSYVFEGKFYRYDNVLVHIDLVPDNSTEVETVYVSFDDTENTVDIKEDDLLAYISETYGDFTTEVENEDGIVGIKYTWSLQNGEVIMRSLKSPVESITVIFSL